jgi:hypothetical protein
MISKEEYYNLEGYVNYSLLKGVSNNSNLAFFKSEEVSDKLRRTFDIGNIMERYFLEDKDLSYIKIDKNKELSGHSAILKDILIAYCKENNISDVTLIPDKDILSLISEKDGGMAISRAMQKVRLYFIRLGLSLI